MAKRRRISASFTWEEQVFFNKNVASLIVMYVPESFVQKRGVFKADRWICKKAEAHGLQNLRDFRALVFWSFLKSSHVVYPRHVERPKPLRSRINVYVPKRLLDRGFQHYCKLAHLHRIAVTENLKVSRCVLIQLRTGKMPDASHFAGLAALAAGGNADDHGDRRHSHAPHVPALRAHSWRV